ncbi:unnamed protein product [Chrysoparadoxa australica]
MRVNLQWIDMYVQLFGAKTTYDAVCASVARVEVAVAEGCPFWEGLFARAAGSGNLRVCMKLHRALGLQWLRGGADPCPWGETTCMGATEGGHLEVLKWLR